MPAYHQMGHDSWNLVADTELGSFGGIVLSPVNNGPADTATKVAALGQKRDQLDIVLDPQFYKPKSDRGTLPEWAHITNNFETADLGDEKWWAQRCQLLVQEAARVGATSIASPAILPRSFDSDYYGWVVNCCDMLHGILDPKKIATLVTALVHLPEIGKPGAAERIASILTRTRATRVYLVLCDDVAPRAQRMDSEALAGAISLIRMLEAAGSHVLVACTGLDMLLWKFAGATHVATGKFFNLRRFVPGRWDDPEEKGRVVPYWTDDDLVTWLREDEVRLLLRLGFVDPTRASANPFSREILALLDRRKEEAWLRLGWLQYLYWFSQREADVAAGRVDVRDMLRHADTRWAELERRKVYLFDRANNGEWVRAWLNAFVLLS
jgi:hypothetical protein